MSLLQGYPSAALYNVRVSEIRVKVSAHLRNTWLYYTKDTSENKTPSVTEMEDNEKKKKCDCAGRSASVGLLAAVLAGDCSTS